MFSRRQFVALALVFSGSFAAALPADAAKTKKDKIEWIIAEGTLAGYKVGSGNLAAAGKVDGTPVFGAAVKPNTKLNKLPKLKGLIGTTSITANGGVFMGQAGPIIGANRQQPFLPLTTIRPSVGVIRVSAAGVSLKTLSASIVLAVTAIAVIPHPRLDAADALEPIPGLLTAYSEYVDNLPESVITEDQRGQLLAHIDVASGHLVAAMRNGRAGSGPGLQSEARFAILELQAAVALVWDNVIP